VLLELANYTYKTCEAETTSATSGVAAAVARTVVAGARISVAIVRAAVATQLVQLIFHCQS
jgi:hypothetical protein